MAEEGTRDANARNLTLKRNMVITVDRNVGCVQKVYVYTVHIPEVDKTLLTCMLFLRGDGCHQRKGR